MANSKSERRLPVGAEVLPSGGVHFRVWAPRTAAVAVVFEGGPDAVAAARPEERRLLLRPAAAARAGHALPLPARRRADALPRPGLALPARGPARPVAGGRPAALSPGPIAPGAAPASRARSSTRCTSARSPPKGPGRRPRANCRSWPTLGVTVLEVMPVADFPGRFGWGYDGVDLFAPTRLYGTPDDFRRFVDRAHAARPRRHPRRRLQPLRPRRQLPRASSADDYFTDRYKNEWGEAINFDGAELRPGARVLPRQRRLLDRRVPPRRPAPRRHAADLRRRRPTTSWRPSAGASARRPRGRATLIVAENEPQDDAAGAAARAGRLRPRRALERRLPPHAPWSP